jgi:hypothetical protein
MRQGFAQVPCCLSIIIVVCENRLFANDLKIYFLVDSFNDCIFLYDFSLLPTDV